MENENWNDGFEVVDPLSGFDEVEHVASDESGETVEESTESVQDSIRTLLADVQGLRPVFEGIIDFCRTEKRPVEVDEKYEELTEFNACTFSPVRVRAMLEEVGALVYSEPVLDDENQAEAPEEAAVNEGCYEITVRPEGWWLATEAGLEVVDTRNPVAEVAQMLRLEPEFIEEFRKVIEALAEGPKSIAELEELVDNDEPMVASHRYASFLIKRLETCGAIEFRGKWTLLEPGQRVLSEKSVFALES